MKRGACIITTTLVVLGFLLWGGCQAPAPTPVSTPTSTPTSVPTPTASPTATPIPTPTASPTQPAVIKWNMQSVYPLTSTYTIFFGIEWAKWVEDITNGRIKIEFHPPGTFASGTDVLKAVGKGTLDVSLDYAGLYGEVVPISMVEQGIPMAWKSNQEAYDAFYNRGLRELVVQEYGEWNVFPLVSTTIDSIYHIGTVFPFNSLDDIKGKKIRAGGSDAEYIGNLGGKPTIVVPAEMYMALKTGLLDGMMYGSATLKSMKLAEVIKSYIISPTVSPIAISAPDINMDKWKALPADIRHLLEENSKYFYALATNKYRLDNEDALRWAVINYGTKLVTLSAEDEQKARKAAMPIWDKIAKVSPRAAKAVEIVRQQMKDYGR